jgi:hypothetical protein
MTKIHSFSRKATEDLPILEHKVMLHHRRLKGRCDNCRKNRLEAIEFISPDNPKMSHRLAVLMFKFCEVAPVVRIAEILDRSKMSLWRNDLLLLQNQLQNYKIPAVNKISVDEVYAKAHHSNVRKPLRPFFHNNRRLRNP